MRHAESFITNAGFIDLLEIGRSDVPFESMYDFRYVRPEPLVPRRYRFEVGERTGADGSIVHPLDESEVIAAGQRLVDEGQAEGLRAEAAQLVVDIDRRLVAPLRILFQTSIDVSSQMVQDLLGRDRFAVEVREDLAAGIESHHFRLAGHRKLEHAVGPFEGHDGLERRTGELDGKVHLALMPDIDDPAVGCRTPVGVVPT